MTISLSPKKISYHYCNDSPPSQNTTLHVNLKLIQSHTTIKCSVMMVSKLFIGSARVKNLLSGKPSRFSLNWEQVHVGGYTLWKGRRKTWPNRTETQVRILILILSPTTVPHTEYSAAFHSLIPHPQRLFVQMLTSQNHIKELRKEDDGAPGEWWGGAEMGWRVLGDLTCYKDNPIT